jgi:hypothetical protein
MLRHREHSVAIQRVDVLKTLDCHVALLLAMTGTGALTIIFS